MAEQPTRPAATLTDLIQIGEPVNHAALDRLPGQEIWSLRRSLVDLGVYRIETNHWPA